MGWRDHLGEPPFVAPWFGRRVVRGDRVWRVTDPPEEHGWYLWEPRGRKARVIEPAEPSTVWAARWPQAHGHLVGDRLFRPQGPDLTVYCGPPCDRFDLICVTLSPEGAVYAHPCFLPSAAPEARLAFERDNDNLWAPGATPELRRAYRWAVEARRRMRAAAERRRVAREKMEAIETAKAHDTAVTRRVLMGYDVEEAARRALRVTGAELLDCRDQTDNTHVITYRFRGRRLECVVDNQLRIVDAGICLTDESTGTKYDTLFTLESLPGVVGEAMDNDALVVWRYG